MYFINLFGALGLKILRLLSGLGSVLLFTKDAILSIFRLPIEGHLFVQQFLIIGFFSLPIVGFTAIFSGAVLALQSYVGFARFGAEDSIANVVVLSITRELGPVLAGLMVAGRTASSIAAEIGTMRVTEQIDALRTLGTDPLKYLVIPRIVAGIIMLPCLVLVADIIGIFGGYLVGVYKLGFNSQNYIANTMTYLEFMDVASGLIKASVFGGLITIISCYNGYYCTKGAKGVGEAVINAVVSSSVMILLSNYMLTELFFTK